MTSASVNLRTRRQLRRRWLASIVAASSCVLASCVLSDRSLPSGASIAPHPEWRTPAGSDQPIERDWWHLYGDAVLSDLVERALENNTDVAVAAARVRESEAQLREVRSQFLPTVDAVIGGTRSRTLSAFGSPSTGWSAEPQLQAAWQLDLFGRVRDLAGAARAQYLASQAAHDATRLSVASSVATNYITLRALDARLEVARDTLRSRSEALRIARSRASAGYTSQLELAQARAEYEATALIIPQVEQAIAQQENALNVLTGEAPSTIPRGVALGALAIPPIPDGLPAEVLRRRPDIAQAEYQLAATDRSLAAARKAFLPNVQLTGSAGVLRASGLSGDVGLFSLGASVLQPIFDAGAAVARRDTAAAVRDQAAFAYRATVLNAFREVENGLVSLDRLEAQAEHVEAQRDALAEALRHATNRYRAGYSGYLDQLDAQRGLLNAQLSLVQIQSDGLVASVSLYRAMGGGWTAPVR